MTADTKPAGAMELKGCPFCNGEPQLVCGGPGNWYVRCLQCKAAGDDATRDRAAELWNTRALPAEAGAIRESVREEIARIICCNGKCILSDSAGGCILNDPAHDGDLKKADAILALSPPAERLGTDPDHPDCATDRERELYDALMGLASHVTSRFYDYPRWTQGGVKLHPIVDKALRLSQQDRS